LAKRVLEGKTKGYKNHPQLERFKNCGDPVGAINAYLYHVWLEGKRRGYNFDFGKVGPFTFSEKIPVKEGQVNYEFSHLLRKLMVRDRKKYEELKDLNAIEVTPIFVVVPGGVEDWEKLKHRK